VGAETALVTSLVATLIRRALPREILPGKRGFVPVDDIVRAFGLSSRKQVHHLKRVGTRARRRFEKTLLTEEDARLAYVVHRAPLRELQLRHIGCAFLRDVRPPRACANT
jgi:hypothetical protein